MVGCFGWLVRPCVFLFFIFVIFRFMQLPLCHVAGLVCKIHFFLRCLFVRFCVRCACEAWLALRVFGTFVLS